MKKTTHKTTEAGKKQRACARAHAQDAERITKTTSVSCDSVAVTKEFRPDGAVVTTVVHPPRPLRTPGEIRAAYQTGQIDLDQFTTNVMAGLKAMKAVTLTDSQGTGKDRTTTQRVEYVPDMDARLKWQDHITNTVEGMPVKRQEIVSKKIMTQEDLMKKAKQSPALLRSLLESLTELEQQLRAEGSNNGGGKN